MIALKPAMCRSIQPLLNFDPPASEEEIRSAALHYVRKIAGMRASSRANAAAFGRAVEEVAGASARLLGSLSAAAAARTRTRGGPP